MFKQYKLKNYKFILIALVVILNTIGVALVGSASPGDQKKQIIGMVSGIIIMLLVSYIDYNFILRFSWLIYLGAIGLLGLVIVAGEQSKGAQRWFKIGGFQFQPSELVKILMILFLAYYFMRYEEKINSPRVLFGSFVLIGIPLALILAQPNLSTTIVLALVFAAMLFAAGLSYKIVVGVLAVCVPTFFIVLTLIIQDKFPFIHSYQLGRIMGWLYPDKYPDIAYQQQNSIMAIGSGLLWGKGLGNTDPTSVKNGKFILEPQNDFIFSIVCEELGFVGAATVILLFLLFLWRGISIAMKAPDVFSQLVVAGIVSKVVIQAVLNIAVVTKSIPNTGISLPFFSYGGSSLCVLIAEMGIVLSISRYTKQKK